MKKFFSILFVFLFTVLISAPAMARALTISEIEAGILYCLNNGIVSSDPIVIQGSGTNIGQVNCMKADIKSAPDTPAPIGVNHILLVTE